MRGGLAALVAALTVTSAGAAHSSWAQPRTPPLAYDPKVDGAITVLGAVAWAATETVFKDRLAPARCRWCDGGATLALNPLDANVRDALRWRDLDAGDTASAVTGFVLTPAAALGLTALAALHDDRGQHLATDALIIVEATVVAVDLNQLVKFAAARQRPLIHDGRAYPANDANLSFYSGHTNLAFALAVASGTVASMRSYRRAWLVWTTGLALATATGYFRIAGDRHYFTDVATGAIAGAGIGFAVPYWRHRRGRPRGVVTSPAGGGVALGVSGTW